MNSSLAFESLQTVGIKPNSYSFLQQNSRCPKRPVFLALILVREHSFHGLEIISSSLVWIILGYGFAFPGHQMFIDPDILDVTPDLLPDRLSMCWWSNCPGLRSTTSAVFSRLCTCSTVSYSRRDLQQNQLVESPLRMTSNDLLFLLHPKNMKIHKQVISVWLV